jgi:hypothetical protein
MPEKIVVGRKTDKNINVVTRIEIAVKRSSFRTLSFPSIFISRQGIFLFVLMLQKCIQSIDKFFQFDNIFL